MPSQPDHQDGETEQHHNGETRRKSPREHSFTNLVMNQGQINEVIRTPPG